MNLSTYICSLSILGFCLSALFFTPSVSAQTPDEDLGAYKTDEVKGSENDLTDHDFELLKKSLDEDVEQEFEPPAATQIASGQSASGSTGFSSVLQSMNPDISVIFDGAASWFSNTPQQLGAHDPNKTGFTLQQLEMHIASSVDPYLRFEANIVFSQFGVEVEEAYATTLSLPWGFQIRGGQFLTRFGRKNPTHPHSWHFTDQPLVNGKFFGAEGSRGLGGEVSWLAPLPWFVELVSSVNEATGQCCARSFFGGDDLGVRDPRDLLYTSALKQFFDLNDNWGLFWGLSNQVGPNPTGNGNRSIIYGTDFYLRYRPIDSTTRQAISIQGELLYRRRQVPGDVLVDVGAYLQAIWKMDLRWETGLRYEFVTGALNDYLDPQWTQTRHRASAQLTFYPSHFSRLRLQSNFDHPNWQSKPIWALIGAVEVLIGSHGSHDY